MQKCEPLQEYRERGDLCFWKAETRAAIMARILAQVSAKSLSHPAAFSVLSTGAGALRSVFLVRRSIKAQKLGQSAVFDSSERAREVKRQCPSGHGDQATKNCNADTI